MKARFYNIARILIAFAGIILAGVYLILCFLISSDRFQSERQIFQLSFLNYDFHKAIHSSDYYVRKGTQLQYMAHQPPQISAIFKSAVLASPADALALLSYAEYLNSQDCCNDQIGLLLEESLRRDSRAIDVQRAAIVFFLKEKKEEKAYLYFKRALNLEVKATSQLVSLMVEHGARADQLLAILPRTKDHSRQLLRAYASRGSEFRLDWIQVLNEAEIVDSREMLETANQAMRIGEFEIARKYALLALEHPETKTGAEKMLKRLSKR